MPQNWDWNAENQLSAEYWYGDNKEALASVDRSSEDIYGETGIWYLANHTAWKDWVPTDVRGRVEAALAR